MVSGSPAKIEGDLRAAAARGEPTPLTMAGWIRLSLRTIAVIVVLIALLPLHYFYRIFAYGSPFPMLFLRAAARICGARVKTIGVPLRRDVFFIANHISWLDILALAGASGTAFVSKAELADVPIVGWLASLNRTVFVKRESRLGVAAQINALREALADNWSITVFPEGTVTDGHSLLPFKTSMLRVLEPPPPGVMVQPVMLDYGEISEWIGWVGDESGLNNAQRVLARRGTFPLKITFLEPFDPNDHSCRKTIAARAREEIEAALVKARGAPLRDYKHSVDAVRYQAPAPNYPIE